jgi:hypothetical protein
MTKDKDQARMFLAEVARLEAEKEHHFCPRCGMKLVGDERHTCTPPKDKV